MISLLEAYINIFRLNPDIVRLNRVKFIGKTVTNKGDKVYNFLAIVTVPTEFPTMLPIANEMVKMRNKVRTQLNDFGGPIFNKKISWVQEKDGKTKKKSFDFSFNLDSESVLEFEIIDGMYFIKIQAFGLFYE